MSGHNHDWSPIVGERGRYRCACSAIGWRTVNGEIREYTTLPKLSERVTARQIGDGHGMVPERDAKIGWER